jgi:putative transcriptional regulator
LREAVARLPLRYAPFYDRLAALWEIPIERAVSELSRAAEPRSWSVTFWPGFELFNVDLGETAPGRRARLMRFQPGLRFPRHEHQGCERALVLEGAFADDAGNQVRAGDEQTCAAGSEHELYILGHLPCVTAVCERGIAFTGPLLRFANGLFR